MSKDSKPDIMYHAGQFSGEAKKSAGILGKSRRYRLRSSLNVLNIHLAAHRGGALRFAQVHKSGSKNEKDRSFGSPARVVFGTITIFLASQLLAGLIVGLGIWLFTPGSITDKLDSSPLSLFFFFLLAEGLTVGLVLLLLRRKKIGLKSIGLRKPKANDITKGLIGFAVFYAVLIISLAILSVFFPGLNDTQQDIGFNNLSGSGGRILALISLVLLPPLAEEVLARGYLFSGLRARLSFIRAGLITSLLFSFAHLQLGDGSAPVWGAAVATFVLSLVLVYLRESTGAIYAGICVHLLNNLIAFGVKFY